MKNLKSFTQFNENFHSVDIMDDLKSNFRSWEMDSDNEQDAENLYNILMTRHSDLKPDEVREIAYDWVGYEPKNEEE
jgi:hypothetical protein